MIRSRSLLFFLACGLYLIAPLTAAMTTKDWLTLKLKVVEVPTGDRIVVDYKGLQVSMTFAHLKIVNSAKAKDFLKAMIEKKRIRVLPEYAMGMSKEGLPQVYAFLKQKENVFLNEELIRKGFASFAPGKTEKYGKFLSKLKDIAKAAPPPPKYRENKSGYCGELNSRRYHVLTCKWAKRMKKQSQIIYDSLEAAEKAGKHPCSLCMYERVKDLRAVASKNKAKRAGVATGGLLGIKGNKVFYSPVSKKIAKTDIGKIVKYSSLKEAKASGRKADTASLRIDNPVVPGPSGDECIGRALPFFRPCRRPQDHPTGLCEPCLNGRMR